MVVGIPRLRFEEIHTTLAAILAPPPRPCEGSGLPRVPHFPCLCRGQIQQDAELLSAGLTKLALLNGLIPQECLYTASQPWFDKLHVRLALGLGTLPARRRPVSIPDRPQDHPNRHSAPVAREGSHFALVQPHSAICNRQPHA